MQKLNVTLENCYGIKKLSHTFDFSQKSTFAIYASNGIMKTSFAKTFIDLSKGEVSKDLIDNQKNTIREITDENLSELNKDSIFVIEPYNESYKSDKVSTLLANKELKGKYDNILKEIDKKKEELLKELRLLTGFKSTSPIEKAFSMDFMFSETEFFKAIIRIKGEVTDKTKPVFENIIYNEIFNTKVEEFIKNNQAELSEYIRIYEDLLLRSTYFKKGCSHTNVSTIAKNLKDNGFFKAKHSITLLNNKGKKETIFTEEDLESAIQDDLDSIINDKKLLDAFNNLDDKLEKNTDLSKFKKYLFNNLNILPELKNLQRFKQQLWTSYLKTKIGLFNELENIYSEGEEEIEKILEQSKEQIPAWMNVIDIFNERFSVPFDVGIGNQEDIILRKEKPTFEFHFSDDNGNPLIPVNEKELLKVLSNGEKRALYILNIIFEVQARRQNNQETLFIIDDIADSFDYKNKYAIIEYLKDISETPNFKQIILTHNFDFYRSITGRLEMLQERAHKLNVLKTNTEIKLIEEFYQENNPFKHWKKHLHLNNAMLIASIPFVRNLAEFSGNKEIEDKLTHLLHIKSDTYTFDISELQEIYRKILVDKSNLTLPNPLEKIINIIYSSADAIISDTTEVLQLEDKIVLSIAIRLKSEKFMIQEINDEHFCNEIKKVQSRILLEKFKELFSGDSTKESQIKLLKEVSLMTPENIHVNSFMYEPILDMSNEHLKVLYIKTKAL